jgi:hypothetical protein
MERIGNPQPEKEWGGRRNCLTAAEKEAQFLGDGKGSPKK